MQPNQSIIVYRSQSEANVDYFWNQMAFPWMFDHWYLFVGALVVGIIWYNIANR